MSPRIVLVAAMANDRVIGIDNTLPWHLPEDLKHFKAVTLGKPVIMGRIVITRQTDWQQDGVTVAHSLPDALALAGDAPEVCIIGGANLYAQALPLADAMALTHITLQIAGDAHFPAWDAQQWQVAWQPQQVAANGLTYQFADYTRR